MKDVEFEELKPSDSFKYELYFQQLCLENGIDSSVQASGNLNEKFDELHRTTTLEACQEKQELPQRTTQMVNLKLKTLLSLKFHDENRFNYMKKLNKFLQSKSLVDVVEEEEEGIILRYRSREELMRLLSIQCNIKTISSLQKLEQRAAFQLLPEQAEYKVLVFLKDSPDLKSPVKEFREVFRLLKDYRTRVKSNWRIDVHVPDLYQVIQLLTNKEIQDKCSVTISRDNFIYRSSCSKGLHYLNGDPCVTEKQLLKMVSGRVDITADLAKVVSNSKVKDVFQDWNNEIILTFRDSKNYLQFMSCFKGKQSIDDSVDSVAIVPHDDLYSLVSPFQIDIRDFFPIDTDCLLSKDSREICSRNKMFPFQCFTDEFIMKKYSVKLSDSCIVLNRK